MDESADVLTADGMPARDEPGTATTTQSHQCSCAGPATSAVVSANLDVPTPVVAPYQVATPSYVYAIGNVEARFPTLSVEKEFAQAMRGTDTAGLSDQETFRSTLIAPENRYLARQMCWVLTVQGFDTYLLQPRDPADYELLIEAIRPAPSPLDLDAVIGTQGPLASPAMCNGLIVPVVAFDQIYSFDRDALTQQVPRKAKQTDEQHGAAVSRLLEMILRIADNAGASDEHRALNYLAMRFDGIYNKSAEQFDADFALSGVEVTPSALGGDRVVLNCIFTYTHRQTGFIEKWVVPVDVTEKFPFLVGPISPYYDRV